MTTSPSSATTEPTKALVVTFDETTWTDGGALDSQTVTPDYAGVLPPNSAEATALGAAADRPVDGKAFNPAFLGAILQSVRAHFWASQDNQPNKVPAAVTFEAAPMAVNVTTQSASHADGLTLGVSGTGFTGTDGNPGDDGVYVGLAPSGELPDVSSQAGMASFAGSSWVMASGIVNGAFSTSLTAPTENLDATKSYSIYTWRAHGHSSTSQDTETPVTIDWTQLEEPEPAASTVTPSGPSSKVYGATATLTAAVSGPGSVTLTGVGASQTKEVAGGAVSFTVPAALAVGSYTATFAYSGSAAHLPSQATKALTVTKATPTLKASWKKKPTTKKRGKLVVKATGPSSVAAPAGVVVVKVSSKGVTRTVRGTLVKGVVTLKLPKLTAGTWKVRGTYKGAGGHGKATSKELTVTI